MRGKPEMGPMQGVSCSKGSLVMDWQSIHTEATNIFAAVPEKEEALNKIRVGKLYHAQRPLMRSAYSTNGTCMSSVNVRNNMRMGNSKFIPLEFVYEAADCKSFYTADMIRNVENV
jgi:hypothetical protein